MSSTKNTIVTSDLLRRAGACSLQRELFAKTFPDGVTVSIALARRYAHEFDFSWAVENLLSRRAREQFDADERPAWEQYVTSIAVAFATAAITHGLDVSVGRRRLERLDP